MEEIKIGGIYRHYKGNKYKVIGIGKHSETLDDLVIYQNIEHFDIWVRPKEMWFDKIDKDTKRFTLVE